MTFNFDEDREIGFMVVSVLPYLKGRPLDDIAKSFISTLRPSSVRVIEANGSIKLDAQTWRVTVYMDENGAIDCIEQEVECELPEDMYGDELMNKVPGCNGY